MPLYEYACRSCGTHFEALEKPSAPSPRPCPSCGQPARRQLGASLLQFKGSGWYVTDYGKGKAEGPAPTKSAA